MKYYPTPLESWISKLYKSLGMYSPKDIDEKTIAHFFRIFLYYKEMKAIAYENGRFKSITLDSRMDRTQQRESFFHELCHILRHVGWQAGMMPAAFRELQEYDSRNFTRYAAIPFHMLHTFDIRDPNIVTHMSEAFTVSPGLVHERLERIKYSAVSRIMEQNQTHKTSENKHSVI